MKSHTLTKAQLASKINLNELNEYPTIRTKKQLQRILKPELLKIYVSQIKNGKFCSMCTKTLNNGGLCPSKCLSAHGAKAHRICNPCWWSNFAKENKSHKCPGCEKKYPLRKSPNAVVTNVIELE